MILAALISRYLIVAQMEGRVYQADVSKRLGEIA
jgi:hypothetical protein